MVLSSFSKSAIKTARFFCNMRCMQIKSFRRFYSFGGLRSGCVVLPCGAGKTLLGICVACRVGGDTVIICLNSCAVEHWRRQFLMWTFEEICLSREVGGFCSLVVTTYYMTSFC